MSIDKQINPHGAASWKLLLASALVLVGALAFPPIWWSNLSDSEKADSLKDASFAVRTIDPEDEEFSDLEPLVQLIGDRRFVLMTEATHASGATFAARHRLIRFLHTRMGFDVLAIETAFFGLDQINESLSDAAKYEAIATPRGTLHPFRTQRWLFDYVHRTRQSGETPIQMLGMHPRYDQQDKVIQKLREFFRAAGVDAVSATKWDEFEAVLKPFLTSDQHPQPKSPEPRDIEAARAIANELRACIETNRLALLNEHGQDRVHVFESVCNSLPICVEHVVPGGIYDPRKHRSQLQLRDEAMASFIMDAAAKRFPGKRFIVTGAFYHLMRQEKMLKVKSMADFLHEELSDQIYTIAFEPYSGRHGLKSPGTAIPNAGAGTMAELLHRSGDRYRFLDLQGLPHDHWLRHEPVGGNMHFVNRKVLWPSYCDAVFFIDQEKVVWESD